MRRFILLLITVALRAGAQPVPDHHLGPAPLSPPLRWLQQATLPSKHPHVGDLCSIGDELFIAASTDPLTSNGQGLYRYSSDGRLTAVIVRSGQGFLRVQDSGGRIFVPDADAPFNASIVFRLNIDGFVYSFDPRAPDAPKREVIPKVYHVFDTALLEGRVYAACGAYASNEIPYRAKRNPAALYLRESAGKPWRRILEYPRVPEGTTTGVVRFTYLTPLPNGAMLAGLTDWSQTVGGDGAVLIEGLPDHPTVRRVVGLEGNTMRWGHWRQSIYQISESNGVTRLNRSIDGGLTFSIISTSPPLPQSFSATVDSLFLLADGILYCSQDGTTFTALTAQNPSLRHHADPLLTAPLVFHQGKLWAADPQHGTIWAAEP